MKMKTKTKPQFSDELLDQIIASDMLGGDWTPIQNKLDGIKAALMERMLRGEMTHHLGYQAGEEAVAESTNRRKGAGAPLTVFVPVFAMMMLGETVRWNMVLGVSMIIDGVYVSAL